MTIADRLRAELANDAELVAYKQKVLEWCIKYTPVGSGKFTLLYGSHINECSNMGFPARFHDEIVSYIRANGFNVSERVNGYEVKYILVTL